MSTPGPYAEANERWCEEQEQKEREALLKAYDDVAADLERRRLTFTAAGVRRLKPTIDEVIL
jgi:hypothetical protein